MTSLDDQREQGEQDPDGQAITSLEPDATDMTDLGPADHVEVSLKSALTQLREHADKLAELSGDEQVAAAEQLAEEAAALDEKLGSIARHDDA